MFWVLEHRAPAVEDARNSMPSGELVQPLGFGPRANRCNLQARSPQSWHAPLSDTTDADESNTIGLASHDYSSESLALSYWFAESVAMCNILRDRPDFLASRAGRINRQRHNPALAGGQQCADTG